MRGLLVVLWELGSLPPERLPRQLIARILTRVYKFAAVVLRAGGRLSVQCKYVCLEHFVACVHDVIPIVL